MLMYALLFRRTRLAVLAAALASLVFAAWEVFIACRYGESHFLYHLRHHSEALQQNRSAFLSLVMILGGVAPANMLLALVALRARTVVLALAGIGVVLGFALLPYFDDSFATRIGIPLRLNRDSLIFGGLGYLLCGSLAFCIRRLCTQPPLGTPPDLKSWFLVLWLGLEIAGYYVLSPFPAVRRVQGIDLVSLLLIGRLLSCAGLPVGRRLRAVLAAGIVLGLGYYGVDLFDARAQKRAAEQAAAWVRSQKGGSGWYVGHWGFQHYAERAGLQALVPEITSLHRDDWLIVPCSRVDQQKVQIPDGFVLASATWSISDPVPFRTASGYYGSRTPIEPLHGPRLSVTIYRVLKDFSPRGVIPMPLPSEVTPHAAPIRFFPSQGAGPPQR
jgi:hypothetical protein